jgi:hypothetical protein
MDAAEAEGLLSAVVVFVKGCLGGVATLVGLGFLVVPNLLHTHGATRSSALQKQKQKQQRCLELGLTLEELEALEAEQDTARGEAPGPGLR